MSALSTSCFVVLTFICQIDAYGRTCNPDLSVNDCGNFEFCSRHSDTCEPCSNICEKGHNYDEYRCKTDCQSYLKSMEKDEYQNLRLLVSISLALNCVVILVLLTIGLLYLLKHRGVKLSWLSKRFLPKKKTNADRGGGGSSVSVTTSSGKPDLRLDMPSSVMQTPINGNTPSTATTTLSRRPTEDNTLDYAYDNPAMASTPSPYAKPHESSL